MSTPALTLPRRRARASAGRGTGGALARGTAVLWLSAIVLLPLAALTVRSLDHGVSGFWDAATSEPARHALTLSLACALVVAAIQVVMGTLIAWVLVRDEFRGKRVIDTVIDLPFALPTIVAGLTLLALYGARSPIGINVAFTRAGIALALLFVTLPFVVRSVQPVLRELDREVEEAAASLGASGPTTFRRVILPSLLPAILSGAALAFARAIGEFGSLVLISGSNRDTQVAAIYIYQQVQSDAPITAAAVSVVLLALSLAILIGIRFLERLGTRRER